MSVMLSKLYAVHVFDFISKKPYRSFKLKHKFITNLEQYLKFKYGHIPPLSFLNRQIMNHFNFTASL
jgi:hypothetical protein